MQHYQIKQINITPVVKVNSFIGLKYILLYSLRNCQELNKKELNFKTLLPNDI